MDLSKLDKQKAIKECEAITAEMHRLLEEESRWQLYKTTVCRFCH